MQNMAGFESRLMEQLAHTRQEFEDHIRSASGLLVITEHFVALGAAVQYGV